MNTLERNISQVKDSMKTTISSLDSLGNKITNPDVKMNEISRDFRQIMIDYKRNVTDKVDEIKKLFGFMWVMATRDMNMNKIPELSNTNNRNYRSYRNIRVTSLNERSKKATLSRYPKLRYMIPVLSSLQRNKEAAIKIQTAKRAQAAREEANRLRRERNERAERNRVAREQEERAERNSLAKQIANTRVSINAARRNNFGNNN